MSISYVFPYCTGGTGGASGDNYPSEGVIIEPQFDTLITRSRTHIEQRRAMITSPQHHFAYRWNRTTNSKLILATLYDFFVARLGSYEKFGLFEFDAGHRWNAVSTGVTSVGGVQTILSTGRNRLAGTTTVYRDGVADANYSISAGTGANGRDEIITTGSFGTGVVTETYTGQRFFVCRFEEDGMSQTLFTANVFETGVKLIQLFNED